MQELTISNDGQRLSKRRFPEKISIAFPNKCVKIFKHFLCRAWYEFQLETFKFKDSESKSKQYFMDNHLIIFKSLFFTSISRRSSSSIASPICLEQKWKDHSSTWTYVTWAMSPRCRYFANRRFRTDFRTPIDSGLGLDTCDAPILQNWSEL